MSFEAYKVAVRLSLINDVSSGLIGISKQLIGTQKDVDNLHSRLNKLRNLTMLGGAMSAGGIFGLGLISKALKPAEEYTHQLNIMNMAGMKQADIATAVGDAWKLAGQNMTTTATGNLKALLDLRNVTGSLEEARTFLPIMAQMQTVLAASKEGKVSSHSDDLAFSAMKALDVKGAVNDPEKLKRQADLMTRVIIGTQGRVTPEQFQSVFNYARQAKFALSDDFAYKYLPTLMLENATKGGGGGGSKGVGPAVAALYRLTNQGFVNKKSLPLLKELGLLGNGAVLPTSTPGTVVAPLKDAQLAASNSFEWTNKTVIPSILAYLERHHRATSDQNVLQVLNMISRGNQLAGGLLGEFYVKRKNFERDRGLIEGTMSPAEAYQAAMSEDPATAHRALTAAWTNFQTSLMINVVPVVVPALMKLTSGLDSLGLWAKAHPDLTKDIVLGLGALSATMAVGGPLLSGIALTKLAFGGVGGAATTAATAIGSASIGGSLLFGLVALGLTVGGMALLLNQFKKTDIDEKGHPGMRWHSTGHGGHWEKDDSLPQDHVGQRWVPQTRGQGAHWETVKTAADNKMIQVNTEVKLNDKVLARAVTKVQGENMSRSTSGGGLDPHLAMSHPGFN